MAELGGSLLVPLAADMDEFGVRKTHRRRIGNGHCLGMNADNMALEVGCDRQHAVEQAVFILLALDNGNDRLERHDTLHQPARVLGAFEEKHITTCAVPRRGWKPEHRTRKWE